jgi:glycosyltransferase involved in cell wall biosynthesis
MVATFGRGKGHEVFFRALAALRGTVDCVGYVVGGPVYTTFGSQYTFDDLRALAAASGVQDQIVFLGFQYDIPAVLRSLDVVVHASTEPEGFGRVVIEAMACGRAVIATTAGGTEETVRNRENALCVTPGDAESLQKAIMELAQDAQFRCDLGRRGREDVGRRFNAAIGDHAWVKLFLDIQTQSVRLRPARGTG